MSTDMRGSVNVDSLRNVSRFLDIYGPAVGAEREDTGKPLQLTFPSLVYAYRLLVEGRISKYAQPSIRIELTCHVVLH